ncbi:MAG TPA: hypothetical protein PKD86_15715 [Gemmatales bacterium]|nr:hypothetical protein [Gemmatales bacterium]
MSLRVELASPPDREQLVAQIMADDEQCAELNIEHGILQVEIIPRGDGTPWQFSYESLVQALVEAKDRLLNR